MGKKGTGGGRVITAGVELSVSAQKALSEFVKQIPLTKVDTVERVLTWFVSAPDEMQLFVLGVVPRNMHQQFRDQLRQYIESCLPVGQDERGE